MTTASVPPAPCRSLDISKRLREIASKVRCLPPPSSRDPEAFHINRSEQAHEIEKIAFDLWPEGRPPEPTNYRAKVPSTKGLAMSPRRRQERS